MFIYTCMYIFNQDIPKTERASTRPSLIAVVKNAFLSVSFLELLNEPSYVGTQDSSSSKQISYCHRLFMCTEASECVCSRSI